MGSDEFEGTGRPADTLGSTNPIEQAVEHFQEGNMYDAFSAWFEAPMEERSAALAMAISEADKQGDSYVHLKKDRTLPSQLQFILGSFAPLSSPQIEKVFNPQLEITDNDLAGLVDQDRAEERFKKLGVQVGVDTMRSLYAEEYDFDASNTVFQTKFSTTDIAKILRELSGRVKVTRIIDEDTGEALPIPWATFINEIKHSDLLLDETVRPQAEQSVATQLTPETYLANYLAQDHFPDPAFFTEFFKLHPEIADPKSMLDRYDRDPLPASLYFYTMLRRIEFANKFKDLSETQRANIRNNVVKYLMSDEVVQRAIPYLDDENLYGNPNDDRFISGGGGLLYNDKVIETGDAAKAIKKDRFGEVIQLATQHLESTGRHDEAEQLKAREVNGIRFADFLPEAA